MKDQTEEELYSEMCRDIGCHELSFHKAYGRYSSLPACIRILCYIKQASGLGLITLQSRNKEHMKKWQTKQK